MIRAKVTTFKKSGKYYTCRVISLKPAHATCDNLADLIAKDDPSVQYLSPVTSGFGSDEFYHVIDVEYGDLPGFCTFLLKPMGER